MNCVICYFSLNPAPTPAFLLCNETVASSNPHEVAATSDTQHVKRLRSVVKETDSRMVGNEGPKQSREAKCQRNAAYSFLLEDAECFPARRRLVTNTILLD